MIKYFVKTIPGRVYLNFIYVLDVLANALTLGDPREPVSSVLGKLRAFNNCKLCGVFCKLLNFIFNERDHCGNAVLPQIGLGSKNNWGFQRRGWGNFYVVLIVLLLVYRSEVFHFIGRVTLGL